MPANSGFLIQSRFGAVGNFQLVTPSALGGLSHHWRDNDSPAFPWHGPDDFGSGYTDGASLIQSSLGAGPGNLEVVATEGDRLVHYWREDQPPYRWFGPVYFGTGVRGNPALIQDSFGAVGNYDVVVPSVDGGLAHFWRDNDAQGFPWIGPTIFAVELGEVGGVALIQSNFGNPGNLEAVARVGDRLFHMWRDSGPAFNWSAPVPIPLAGLPPGAKPVGVPALIQSSNGTAGNFELVVPLSSGGAAHLLRDNDAPGLPWSPATVFGEGSISAVSLIQSSFGALGNLEAAAITADGGVRHYWRDAQPGGSWSNAILALAPPLASDPATSGEWRVPFYSGVVGVQAVLLHTGKVLFYTYRDPWNDINMSLGDCSVMDPSTGELTFVPMDVDLFCAGPTILADGRVFVAGGQEVAFHQMHTFTPAGNGGSWQLIGDMSDERWYPVSTKLQDGSVHILSGSKTGPSGAPAGPEPASPLNDVYEVYDPAAGISGPQSASFLNQATPYALYPHVFLLPGGELLIQAMRMTWFLRLDSQQLDGPLMSSGAHPRTYPLGAAGVLLPLMPNSTPPYRARVLLIGGGNEPELLMTPASAGCEILDLGEPNPQWRQVASMAQPRVMPDAVLLPDGTVFVTNGSASGFADNMIEPVFQAELYNPASNSWTQMATMRVPRLYHATALLLPDARVLTAGTDGTFNPEPFNIPNTRVEIFSPPYLFRGPRPEILNAPSNLTYGESFSVTTGAGQGQSIASASFIHPGATTHGVNMAQRCIGLEILGHAGDVLSLRAPLFPAVAPPGHYMLFLVDNQGVPSVARFTHIS